MSITLIDPCQDGGGPQQDEGSGHPNRPCLGPHPPPPHRPLLVQLQVCYRSWNHLISDAEYRKELPQIVAGFFYRTWKGKHHFASITGEQPSLPFFPFPIHDVIISDCCSGLIPCWCFGCHYVVCNPATNKWLLLLDNLCSCGEARLGFDLTVSSHFHVFEYGKMREGESVGVSIYSSKSAA